jgi:hypothetical protein
VLSTEYSAEISPDPLLRKIVLVAGALLGVVGSLLIVSLPLSTVLRVLGVILWSLITLRELAELRRAWARCIGLKFIANGEVEILDFDHEWHPAQLVTGSILLRSTGWLRLKTAAGHVFAEPVRTEHQQLGDWRRLQVIWRHVGA